jgi:hypothetical protein
MNILNKDDVKITGDLNVAEEFNKFFSTTGPAELAEKLENNDINPLFKNISNVELRAALSKAKAGKSAGLDNISTDC